MIFLNIRLGSVSRASVTIPGANEFDSHMEKE